MVRYLRMYSVRYLLISLLQTPCNIFYLCSKLTDADSGTYYLCSVLTEISDADSR
jgi:hypothetical protein